MLCGIDPWGLRESRICGCSEMPVVWSSIPLVNMNLVFLLETRVKTKQRLRLLLKEGGQAQRAPTCFSVFLPKILHHCCPSCSNGRTDGKHLHNKEIVAIQVCTDRKISYATDSDSIHSLMMLFPLR